MWQQEGHLVHGERELTRPINFAPHLRVWWRMNRLGNKFVPGVGIDAAFGRNRAEQSIQYEQRARDPPAMTVAGGHAAPVVTAQSRAGSGNQFGDLFDRFGVDTGFFSSEVESVLGVELFKCGIEFLKVALFAP